MDIPNRRSVTLRCSVLGFTFALLLSARGVRAAPAHPLLAILDGELQLSMEKLVTPDGTKPYFIQYAVTDQKMVYVSAALGALTYDTTGHRRLLDVDVRCGDYSLDNTHQIRGEYYGGYDYWGGSAPLPLNDDPLTTRYAL